MFVGGCTLEAVEAVADARQDLGVDVLDAMSSLVDKSLLRCRDATAEDPRFEMLEIVREYALERLAKSGEEQATRRAHAAYSLVLAEEGAQAIAGGEASATLARLDQELPNLRASLDHLLGTRSADWATRLATALLPYWRRREHVAEGRERLTAVLGLEGVSPSVRAGALYAAGLMAGEQADGEGTRALLEESVALYRGLGDARAAAVAQNALGVACQQMGDLAAARANLEAVIHEARRLGDADNLARGLTNLASVAHSCGNTAEAVRLFGESRAIFGERGDRLAVAWTLDQEGDAARDGGDPVAARALYERSLAIFRELDNRGGAATALADLAGLARREGDLEAARRRCQEALALGALGSDRAATRLLEEVAALAAGDRQPHRALALFAAVAALRVRLGLTVPAAARRGSEQLIEEQRNALGDQASRAWSEGWRMSATEALDLARAPR